MGLSGSLLASQFTYISPSASPASATFRNGFQYTLLTRGEDIRRTPGVTIRDILNNAPNTAEFTVDGNAPVPQVGEKVEIHDSKDNDRRLFGGTVQMVEQIYEGLITQLAYRVHAVDFTWLANRKRPFGTYVNTSVSVIVKDLFSKYAPGFTTAHVQSNLAKVTITLDGQKDLVTVLNDLAAAIGGGHWYIDYDMDLHFFHVVPTFFTIPASAMPPSTAFMIVSEGGLIPSGPLFDAGYYLFRHTFLYSDGTESSFQMVSNMLRCTGANILAFAGVPLGVTIGTATCIGRRIYYNKFIPGYPGGDPIEKITGFVQINDNTTTSFTTWFAAQGASVASVVAFASVKTYSTPLVATPGTPAWVLLSDQAAILNFTGGIANGNYGVPAATFVAAPAAGTIASNGSGLPPGWSVGDQLSLAFTARNANGETTLGSSVNLTLTSTGARFTCPSAFPTGATELDGYVSRDAGVTWHRIAAGLYPLQGFNLVISQSAFDLDPANPASNTAIIGVGRGWVGYNGLVAMAKDALLQPVTGGNIVYFASSDVASDLEAAVDNAQAKPPIKSFNGHPAGPSIAPQGTVDTLSADGFFAGGRFQFKVAYLFRDGSVSMPSPASNNIEKAIIYGQGIRGYNLSNIATGPTTSGLDVVARFVYWSAGLLANPNYTESFQPTLGHIWPVPFLDPTWATPGGIIIIPDNVTTTLSQFTIGELGTTFYGYTGLSCGRGNVPYGNLNQQAVSLDPIPMWPNPDGPSLEDTTPPSDITNSNVFLLREGAGDPFSVTIDGSQLRNRVYVIGSGSVVTLTANVGDTQVFIGDIASFSPHGGTVKYDDPGTGDFVQLAYTGVTGVPGQTAITLSKGLVKAIPQGVNIANFFQADDVESQKLMSKVELDANGEVGDGIHEYTIVDNSLKATFQLFMRAYAELELYSKPIVSIHYSTRETTHAGQTVHVDMNNPPCFGDFLIQNVTIDQIHDESDNLVPRYTINGSSVMFELNDLLLKIIGGQLSGGGGSYAGIVPTATTAASAPDSQDSLLIPALSRRRWSSGTITTGGTTDSTGNGLVSGITGTGSTLNQDDTVAVGGIFSNWVRFVPVNLNANLDGYKTSASAQWDKKPKFAVAFRTGQDLFGVPVLTATRTYWVGLASSNGVFSGGSNVFTQPHLMLLANNPSGSGGTWSVSALASGNGAQQVISNAGFFPILPLTHYQVIVQALSTVAGFIIIRDLTHNTQASVNVTFGSYGSADIPGTTDDLFSGYCYGSATQNAIGTNTWIDINALYLEAD